MISIFSMDSSAAPIFMQKYVGNFHRCSNGQRYSMIQCAFLGFLRSLNAKYE